MTRSLLNTHSSPIEDYRQTMQNEALYATRQLAKRQYTWMRKLVKYTTTIGWAVWYNTLDNYWSRQERC